MADRKISTSVELTGEQKYKQAIKECYSEMAKLSAELKRDTTALGNNASAQEKAKVKAENLRKKLAEQEKIVAATKEALDKEAKSTTSNAETKRKLETALAKAEAAANSTKNQISALEAELGKTGNAAGAAKALDSVGDSAAESAQKTANMAEAIDKLKEVAGGVKDDVGLVFTTMLENVKAVVSEITALVGTTYEAVGQYGHIGDAYGGTQEQIQKLVLGMQAAGLETGKLTRLLGTLQTKLSDEDKTLFAEMGIDASTDTVDAFIAIINKMHELKEAGVDVSKYVTGIFGQGERSAEVTRLLNKWDVYQNAINGMQDAGGFLDSSQLKLMNDALDKYNTLMSGIDQLKNYTGATLITILGITDLEGAANTAVSDLITLLNALKSGDQEGAAASVKKFSIDINILAEGLQSAVDSLVDFINQLGGDLKDSDNGTLKLLGTIITTLAGWVDSISKFLDDEKNQPLISALTEFFIGNKMIELLTGKSGTDWVSSIIEKIVEVKAAIMLLEGYKGTKTVTDAAGAATGVSAAAGKTGGWLGSALAFLGNTGAPALAGLYEYFKGTTKLADAAYEWNKSAYEEKYGKGTFSRDRSDFGYGEMSSDMIAAALEYINLNNEKMKYGFNDQSQEYADILDAMEAIQSKYLDESDPNNPFTRLDAYMRDLEARGDTAGMEALAQLLSGQTRGSSDDGEKGGEVTLSSESLSAFTAAMRNLTIKIDAGSLGTLFSQYVAYGMD